MLKALKRSDIINEQRKLLSRVLATTPLALQRPRPAASAYFALWVGTPPAHLAKKSASLQKAGLRLSKGGYPTMPSFFEEHARCVCLRPSNTACITHYQKATRTVITSYRELLSLRPNRLHTDTLRVKLRKDRFLQKKRPYSQQIKHYLVSLSKESATHRRPLYEQKTIRVLTLVAQ